MKMMMMMMMMSLCFFADKFILRRANNPTLELKAVQPREW
jgi:hypothetical protein